MTKKLFMGFFSLFSSFLILTLFCFLLCTPTLKASNDLTYIPDSEGQLICQIDDTQNENNENIATDQEVKEKTNNITTNYQATFYRMIITLFVIVAFLFLTFYMLKRLSKTKMMTANASSSIKILEKRVISPKSVLYLIEVNKEKLLVSESHLEVRTQTLKKMPTYQKKDS